MILFRARLRSILEKTHRKISPARDGMTGSVVLCMQMGSGEQEWSTLLCWQPLARDFACRGVWFVPPGLPWNVIALRK